MQSGAIQKYIQIWLIGNLAHIGELIGHMNAENIFYGVTDDKNK